MLRPKVAGHRHVRPGPFLVVLTALTAGPLAASADGTGEIQFNRDVRPILSNHCFQCHGPDAGTRKAGLRLDRKQDATATLDSGGVAVVPGDLEASDLHWRVTDDDPLVRMPPPGSGKPLSEAQVDILRRWIEQGARWDEHWSLIPPRRPAVPEVRRAGWARNPIDHFVLARLEAEGIAPSPEADRVTLARRLHLDLTGLPPTPEAVDRFVADASPDAYERLVEPLLASPQHAERLAVAWLDLVRYADTVGYHSDVNRSISPFRDYVIRAFQENMPFDRFTVEQLAGDLLPEPTTWQRVASAYNMLIMTTEEGGAQPKEYLAKYAADRVRNSGSVWMGATLGCAECHDHKYDPYTTRDFYAFAAFFADIQQAGVGTPKPTLAVPTPTQADELERLDAGLARLKGLGEAVGGDESAPALGAAAVVAGLRTAVAAEARAIRQARAALETTIRKTITTVNGPPGVTRVLPRGDWLDETGEVVQPTAPTGLPPIPNPDGRRLTRLDLARWLVSREHPQTARVMVNRLWKMHFGAGLSDTLEDLGSQGEWPTHPELLDWLAVEFMDSGWDVRHMIWLMVESAAYRQSSRPRDDLRAIDPANRLYARQVSWRLEAEMIRDSALDAAGLLNREVGGDSVRPYQPAGYWRFLNFPTRDYEPSRGDDQYRRALYTHWQRSLLHPSLLAFDAPSREFCTARRPVSNTPQAALALLNDPTYVEAARALAARTLREGGPDDAGRLTWLWRRVLIRQPDDAERAVLLDLLNKHRGQFAGDPAAARQLLSVGQARPDPDLEPAELAAWTSLARAVLNLDETITRD